MVYVDGYVIPILKKNKQAYKKMAMIGGQVWKKHGALDYWECVAEELDVKDFMTNKRHSPFAKQLRLKPNETVIFSWVVFKNKAHRNAVNKAVMNDPAMSPEAWKNVVMPFDPKRMCYAGFLPLVHR